MEMQYLAHYRRFGYAVHIFFGLKLYDTVDFIAGLNSYQIRDEEILSGLLILETRPLNVICYAFVQV